MMKIHADRTKPATVHAKELDWIASPLKGVERRMLERDGDEVARATTIVRYAPGSEFSPHTHTGGEEFLVLEGVFSDEHGDFPAGYYVRNPVGSSHRPFSKDGCTIMVKLWQMPPEDQKWVRADIMVADGYRRVAPGVDILPLHQTGHETVEVWRLAPGAQLKPATFEGGYEAFLFDGTAEIAGETLGRHDWMRMPTGSRVAASSATGALVLVKHGHLAHELPLPGARQ